MKVKVNIIDQIMNSMTFPVIIIDVDRKISIVNVAGEDFLQSSSKMIQGNPIDNYFPFSSPLLDLIEKCKKEGLGFNEYNLDLSNPRIGIKKNIDIQVTPLLDDNVMLIFIDNAFEKNSSTLNEGAKAGKTMSYLGSMLAHEVKNPLAGIRGAAQLIEKQNPNVNSKLTGLICNEVDRIKRLVENIEIFDSLPLFELRPVNIHSVLRHACDVTRSSQEINVEVQEHFDPSIPGILGNEDQLIQLFLNLITNGFDAIRNKKNIEKGFLGKVGLSTSYKHGSIIKRKDSGERISLPIEVMVSDNGSGIPESYQSNIFEPFVSSKKSLKGGLGLAMAKKIVEEHNGVISFNTSSNGTTFIVNFASEDKK